MGKYYFIILSILISSCNSTHKNDYTYFGGKIINPKCDLILKSEMKILDLKLFLSKSTNYFINPIYIKIFINNKQIIDDKTLLNTLIFDNSTIYYKISYYSNLFKICNM